MHVTKNNYVLDVMGKVEHSRVGKHINPPKFLRYDPETKLCIVRNLDEFLKRTSLVKDLSHKQLLIVLVKPHFQYLRIRYLDGLN